MIVGFDNDAGAGFVKVHEELAVIRCPRIHSGVNNKQPTMNSFYSLFTVGYHCPRMNSGGSNGSLLVAIATPRINSGAIDHCWQPLLTPEFIRGQRITLPTATLSLPAPFGGRPRPVPVSDTHPPNGPIVPEPFQRLRPASRAAQTATDQQH